jgi:hypothetical protein
VSGSGSALRTILPTSATRAHLSRDHLLPRLCLRPDGVWAGPEMEESWTDVFPCCPTVLKRGACIRRCHDRKRRMGIAVHEVPISWWGGKGQWAQVYAFLVFYPVFFSFLYTLVRRCRPFFVFRLE